MRIILSDGIFIDYTTPDGVIDNTIDYTPMFDLIPAQAQNGLFAEPTVNFIQDKQKPIKKSSPEEPTFNDKLDALQDALEDKVQKDIDDFKKKNPDATEDDVNKFADIKRYQYEAGMSDAFWDGVKNAGDNPDADDTRGQDAKNFAQQQAKEEKRNNPDMTTQEYRDRKEMLEEYYRVMSGLDEEQEEEGKCNLCKSESDSVVCDSCRENLDPDFTQEADEEDEDEDKDLDPAKHGDGG